uniref:Uncharacterized protein n=1 Tax=Fagus sylvatica TaxID=28930 RepID=A0A2N9GU05_FAGSY
MGGVAFNSVQFRLGGEIDRLQSEVTRFRAKLDGSEARFVATRGYHSFGKVRGITIERIAWLGMALCVESMAWHGFVCREHGFLWLYLEVAWLGMSLRVVGTYTCTWPKEFELGRIGAYTGQNKDNRGKLELYATLHCVTHHDAASRNMVLRHAASSYVMRRAFNYSNPRLPFSNFLLESSQEFSLKQSENGFYLF